MGFEDGFIARQPAFGVVAAENTVDVYVGQLTSIFHVSLIHALCLEGS